MSPVYEEKGRKKRRDGEKRDKVITQANEKDKDRGGRLRPQV